jgi:valyl-tRNA synthetase
VLLDQFGPDAVRYWAARGRPGTDTVFDRGQLKIGRRLATKLLNASKFVLSFGVEPVESVALPLDRAMLAALSQVSSDATRHFESYDYTRALQEIEEFFWLFCDDYIELVKERAYSGCVSARGGLCAALSVLQRLLAPFLPFVAEEVWSWWQQGSIHRAAWPAENYSGETALFAVAGELLAGIRRAKSAGHQAMRAPVAVLTIGAPGNLTAGGAILADDLRQAAHTERIEFVEGPQLAVDIRE